MNYKVSAIIVFVLMVLLPGEIYGQTTTSEEEEINVFFKEVHVDKNPVPNKPFKISTVISTNNPYDLIVSLSVPNEISITSQPIANLEWSKFGQDRQADWTVISSQPGSYPIEITARVSEPPQTVTFTLDVSIGSQGSLQIRNMDIPGNLSIYSVFPVSITLKNTNLIDDENIMVGISVPSGLQLLSDPVLNQEFLPSLSESIFTWTIKTETSGSFPILFEYSSTNSGKRSEITNINVGSSISSTPKIDITAVNSVILPNVVSPIDLEITNIGDQVVENLKIVNLVSSVYTSLDTPVNVGQILVGDSKSTTLNIFHGNSTLSYLPLPLTVSYSTDGVEELETFQVSIQSEGTPEFRLSNIRTEPSSLYAGEKDNRIDVEVTNIGFSAYDILAKVNLPEGFTTSWSESDSHYLARLFSQESVEGSFYIDIDETAEAGNHIIPIKIVTGDYSQQLDLNLLVSSKAKFELIDVDDSKLYPGAVNVPVQVTLKNIGTTIAETTTTKLVGGNTIPGVRSSGITAVGNEEDLGTILPGQEFVTTFLVNLERTHPVGKGSATMELRWTQDKDDAFLQTIMVPYSVSPGAPYLLFVEGIPMTYVILAILLALGGLFFNQRRKKRMQIIESDMANSFAMDNEKIEFSKIKPIVFNKNPTNDDTKNDNIDESNNASTKEEKKDNSNQSV